MDFPIDYDLFQRLTGTTTGEHGLFYIDEDGIRSTTTSGSVKKNAKILGVDKEISLRKHIQFAQLPAWPNPVSKLLEWASRHGSDTPFDVPAWIQQVAAANTALDSLDVLRTERKKLETEIRGPVEHMLAVDEGSQAWTLAKHQRDGIRRQQHALDDVEKLIRDAAAERWYEGWHSSLKRAGIAAAAVDYAAFLKLTTFSSGHVDDGTYALRTDSMGIVIAIEAGTAYPAHHPMYTDEEMRVAAENQRVAHLDLPTTAELLLRWVFDQVGFVEMDVDDNDVVEFSRRLGTTIAHTTVESTSPTTSMAQKGGIAKNAKNRSDKEKAIELFERATYETKDKAAEGISKELNRPFRTVRDWLKGVKK